MRRAALRCFVLSKHPVCGSLYVDSSNTQRRQSVLDLVGRGDTHGPLCHGTYDYPIGVEMFFRSWKQTFDKRKLRSHKSAHALIELDWSLIGLWGICLFAQAKNHDIPPRKLSVAKVLRAVRRPMRAPTSRPERGQSLFELLSGARIDDYQRQKPKASRDYPRKKKPDKIIAPIIKLATARQRKAARQLTKSLKSAA